MRIFTNTWFQRYAKKGGITSVQMRDIVDRIGVGGFDADLGGNVYKLRLARKGGGKSGGYRIIICSSQKDYAFIVYGFTKSERDNITRKELQDFRKLAKVLLSYTEMDINRALNEGVMFEVL